MAHPQSAHGAEGELALGHVSRIPLLIGVWLMLMFLTFVTVWATHFNLGDLNIWVAMLIATLKAGLVATYFMHLRWDNRFFTVALLTGLVAMFLFLSFAMLDSGQYQPRIAERQAELPMMH